MSILETVKIAKGNVLCREGDKDKDLFLLTEGRLLICSRSGRMVTPLAFIEKNQYFGEMSFFDNKKRSADVLAVEDTTLVKIPEEALKEQVPTWLHIIAKSLTAKLRTLDEVLRDKGIRKNSDQITPLTIEEQREIYKKLVPEK